MRSISISLASALSILLLFSFAQRAPGAGNYPMPTICDRTCWNARAPQCSISQLSGLDRAVIHHTAISTDYDTTGLEDSKAKVRSIQNYHMDVNGWCDVGYHFLADKFGNSFEGREGSIGSLPRGAHDGVNENSMGFSMMGYFHTPYNDNPTLEQRNAIYDLIAWRIPDPFDGFGSGSYGSLSNIGKVAGHRDVSATACPGDLMYNPYIGSNFFGGEARTEINARITGGSSGGGTTVIVDNDDGSPAYTETGTWTTSASNGYNGLTYRFANTGDAATATWTGNLPEAGDWEVSVIYRASTNRATSVVYDIFASDQTHSVSIDQTLNNLVWVSLGTYPFNAGDNSILVDAQASSPGGTAVIADAMKFFKSGPTPTPTETPTPTPTPGPVENVAQSESTGAGSIASGDYTDTHTQDDIAEAVRETESGGKPSSRYSYVEHTWTFNVVAGTAYTFNLDAYRDANGEGDDFVFSYSTDGSSFTPMVTVTKSADDDNYQSYGFTEDVSGTLYVRVTDTDQTVGNRSLDSVYVDHMYVYSDNGGPTPTPSPTPTPTPTPPPPGTSMHVDSIVLDTVNAGQGFKYGRATVTILDDQGSPVSNATVSGTFTGSYNESGSDATDGSGVAVIQTTATQKGGVTFQFCVDDVTHATLTYDSGSNVITCNNF